MEMSCSFALILLLAGVLSEASTDRYEPNWDSLDSRPLPTWYDEAKIGIFIHWGVFSVPSFGSEWFWNFWQEQKKPEYVEFMKENYRPGFTYQDFGSMFTAEFYDPVQWAKIFNASGAQYVVLTSKHHEGFTNWPSNVSFGWNAMDIGPNRDLVGDLADAIRKTTPHIHFGLYHSLFEWFNPLYLGDKEKEFQRNHFVTTKTMPELVELVENYQPDIIWSDGSKGPDWYWNSTIFLAWLFNDSPVKDIVVVNDRWGDGISCKHGSFYTCSDRYNPGVVQPHKWENCMTLDKHSWGYRRNAQVSDYLTIHELLTTMAETVSCGGNLLVNVGPTHDGMVPTLMEERLRQMGQWLNINGECIYASKPWTVQNDTLTPGVWFTSKDEAVYGIVLNWPEGGQLTLGAVESTGSTAITMLGDQTGTALRFNQGSKGLEVLFPPQASVSSQWVWVLKMIGVNEAGAITQNIKKLHL